MQSIYIIIKKELKRVFTDKKLFLTTFILPPVIFIILYTIMGSQADRLQEDISANISKVYLKNPPNAFMSMLTDAEDINILSVEKEEQLEKIKEDILIGETELLIVFEKDLYQSVSRYKETDVIPNINTFHNPSEEYSRKAYNQFMDYLNTFENSIVALRVEKPEYLNAFDIDRGNTEKDIFDQKKAAGKGIGLILPALLTLFLFSGGMGIGMDMIAGEKERGTMGTLLVTPVKRYYIALGKTISLGIISIFSALCYFAGMLITLKTAPQILAAGEVSVIQYGFKDFLMLLTIMIATVFLFVGLICLSSMLAKNMKEAGTLVVPVYMVVIILAFSNVFSNQTPELWRFAIPVYGTTVAMRAIFAFEITWAQFVTACLAPLMTSGLLIYVIAKMFNSEKLIFKK